MIAFYALGGGWGHFTRINSFIQQEGIDSPIKVIVSNPKAATYFSQEQLIIIPESAHQNARLLQGFISDVSTNYPIKACYIDTFPVGILGELTPEIFQGVEMNFLARRLRWDTYSSLIKTPIPFKHIFRFESLEPSHQVYLEKFSERIKEVALSYPKSGLGIKHPVLETGKPIWIVIHTSDLSELEVLIDHARDVATIEQQDPTIVVLSDLSADLGETITLLSSENPQHWYGVADRIFTAAGFNTWYELSHYREKHVCLPFPRKYDDQFWRCRQV